MKIPNGAEVFLGKGGKRRLVAGDEVDEKLLHGNAKASLERLEKAPKEVKKDGTSRGEKNEKGNE